MRKAMVTRTVLSTRVNALCLDVESAEPMNQEFNLSGVYGKTTKDENGNKTFEVDEKKLLKACQKAFDTDAVKVVHIVDSEVVENLYGMDENEFLARAVQLDPNTRKPIEDSEE